uniref:Hexosyltransferase n=1 Tax=Lutzomyia longipalpis TaxID=7200 RepID=A0A1B0GIK7_LUTLO
MVSSYTFSAEQFEEDLGELTSWLQMLSVPIFKIEGNVLAGDLYPSGFSDPNAMLCPEMGTILKALILITSAPNHGEKRQSIRRTWGEIAQRSDVALAFVIGATYNGSLDYELEQESSIHGDLIRGNFIDSYRNLTLKTLAMLEWTLTYCPMTPYLLKTDDDMFINTERLLNFLEAHREDRRKIFGRIAKNSQPHRNSDSKWYLPEESYRYLVYPDFAAGPIYLLTGDILVDLYQTALKTPFLWLEDVFLTGFVAEELKIPREDIGKVKNRADVKRILPCSLAKLVAIHEVTTAEQAEFWKSFRKCNKTEEELFGLGQDENISDVNLALGYGVRHF